MSDAVIPQPTLDEDNWKESEISYLKSKISKLQSQVKEYEDRMTTFQSDIFTKTNENRKLMAQIKDLQSK